METDTSRLRALWIGTKTKGDEDYYDRQAKEKWDKKEKKERKVERLPGEDEREFKNNKGAAPFRFNLKPAQS